MKRKHWGIALVFLFLLFGATALWAPPPAPNPNLQERGLRGRPSVFQFFTQWLTEIKKRN
jgi:hypothetical protein